VLQPLPFDPANPKDEILRNLMWDMRFEPVRGYADGFYLTSQISHLDLKKA
jgi:hypothetical protein